VPEAAEEAARFVHHACQGKRRAIGREPSSTEDQFYQKVIEQALAYLGSKILCPTRVVTCVADVGVRAGQTLASRIYDAYVGGKVNKRFLRMLFCAPLYEPGAARELCFATVERLKLPRIQPSSGSGQRLQMVS
jgi:hypothetical protein